MKKMVKTGFIYLIAALAAGVFFREFTKFNGFSGKTMLSFVHPHLFALGTLLFLLLALFAILLPDLTSSRRFKSFYSLFNVGLPLTSVLMLVRGVFDVRGEALSKGLDAAVSGIAGIGHILTGLALILLMLALTSQADAVKSRR